jgi:NADPH-dependent 7-cyano-7-deazaguanine reductase QueF
MIDTIPCTADVTCEYRTTLEARCPVIDERDTYDVTISWQPAGETFEKHALEDSVDSLSGETAAHEELVERLYGDLEGAAVDGLTVTLRDTEHVDMVVSKQ